MTDGIGSNATLAGLLEIGSADAGDWDASALANWPNIAPIDLARISSAERLAGNCDHVP